MTRVFVPGKNWRLSLAELASFLEARGITFRICAFSPQFFLVESGEGAGSLNVADLGGIIKIGSVAKSFPKVSLEAAFLQKNKESKTEIKEEILSSGIIDAMLEKAQGKYVFGVSVYGAEETLWPVSKVIQRFVGSSIKRELRAQGVKAEFMGFSRDRTYPQLTHVEVLKKNMVENRAEVLLCVGKEQAWLAGTTAVHNPFEFQKRDVGKPKQRKIFAMPPRLARIMVNLSSCTAGKVLIDPFCGVGTILQEALLSNAKVIGLDLNPWCVEAAKENLRWLAGEYGLKSAEYAVLRGDALKLSSKIGEEVDCIVTEPDLGPALHDVPTVPYSAKIVEKLKPLFYGFLKEAHKALKAKGRVVLVTPYFKTRSGKPVTMPIEEKALEVGFRGVPPFKEDFFGGDNGAKQKLVRGRPLFEIPEGHRVGREFHILQK